MHSKTSIKKIGLILGIYFAIVPLLVCQENINHQQFKQKSPKQNEKPFILNKLANSYLDSNIEKSITYSQQAIEAAKLSGDTFSLAEALYHIGYIQMIKGDNNPAFKNMTAAYNYYNMLKNEAGIAKSADMLGALFRMSASYEESLEYHFRSIEIFNELNDTSGIISALNNMGIVYRNLGNKQKTISCYRQALTMAIKAKDKLLSTVYNSLGTYYWYENQYDSAIYYYKQSLNVFPATFLLKERHCAALNNIGNVFRSEGRFDSATYYYQLSIKESKQYGLNNLMSITLKNLAIIYFKTGKNAEALKNIQESIVLAEKSDLKKTIRENYQLLTEIYSSTGDYKKALDCHLKYSAIQDSIYNDEMVNKIAQLNLDFIIQEKEKKEALLKQNLAEQNLRIEKNKSLIIILILIILLLSTVSWLIYRLLGQNKKTATKLQEMNETLEKRVINRTKKLQEEIEKHRITAFELLKAKEKAEESDRLKSAFLANLSHEIRTPMNAIMGFTELLRNKDVTPESKEKFISIVHDSGEHLLNIINDIIEISKIEAGQVSPNYTSFNLNLFMNHLYSSAKVAIPKEKDIELKVSYPNPASIEYIVCDEVKLRQVISNLVNNAIKFTEKGIISFGFKVNSENEITFYVQDTGVGIDKKNMKIIFERFRQVESNNAIMKGGSGLGLSISKAYVEMLGGHISLESELGEGSLFSFTIPLIKGQKEIFADVNHIKNNQIFGNELILIVEDDDLNYMLFKEIFRFSNYQYIRACNGLEAMNACKENQNIQLVLMDIKMPEMDGFEALKEIRSIKPNLKVIAQTAYALASDREKIDEAGFDGYLTKPIIKEKLFEMISEILKK